MSTDSLTTVRIRQKTPLRPIQEPFHKTYLFLEMLYDNPVVFVTPTNGGKACISNRVKYSILRIFLNWGVKIAFWNKKQIKVKNSAVRGSKAIWGMERYGFMSLK